MKSILLAITSLLMMNLVFGQTILPRNSSNLPPESSQIASEYFSKIYGNSGNNTFTKAIATTDHYYIIGKNNERATVTKIDFMGNLVWTRETSSEGTWRDIMANKDGNLLLVGVLGPINSLAKSLIGVVNANTGNFISLKSYDFIIDGRELLKSIYKNPRPANASFPYYITGVITNSGNEDDVILVNSDDNGTINFIKRYANSDDEFYQGITMDGRFGEMMLYGAQFTDGTQGTTLTVDKDGNILSGRVFNTALYFFCHLSNSNPTVGFNHILGGRNTSNNRARLVKVNGNVVVYNYDIDQINTILHLYAEPGTQSFIAIGTGNFGGVNKTAVMRFTDNGTSLTLDWTKLYETSETAMADGFGNYISSNKFLFLDSRTNHRNNLGNSDGFLTITESNFENCIDNDITLNITPIVDISNDFAPTVSDLPVPSATNESSNNIVYNDADICQLQCSVSFTYTLDKCGEVDFVSQTNLTGNVTYSWTFGTTPQSIGSLANPSYSYFSNGTYNVCLSVSNGVSSCRICQNILVNNADTQKPVIDCPSNISLTNDPGRCFASFTPIIPVTDNCDPDPECDCTLTGATTGNIPKNTLIQFNVGVTTVTCIATDTSGNVSRPCIFTINVLDREAPKIMCPPNFTISCDQQPLPSLTGQATATDNCPGVVITYSDNFTGNSCSGTITRTWMAEDASGSFVTCVQLIIIEDNVAPAITCPANVTINCDQLPLPSLTGIPQVVDNCQPRIVSTYTDTVIGIGCNRYIQRTWSANDGCGNIATCVQNIYFIDLTAPVVVCPPNLTIDCLPTDWMTASFGTATGTDNCGAVTISNFDRTYTGTNCNGTISSWWRATDECGIQNECVQTITIMDTVPPTIVCPPNLTIACNANIDPSTTGIATSTDNCISNLTIRYTDAYSAQGCNQNLIRTWTASDGCGNSSSCTQTITLTDDIAPNVMCPPDITLSCGANTSPAFTGEPTISDFCQSNLIVTFTDITTGPPCDITISRTWTVNDGCGNVSTCIQIIKLEDKTPPTFICPTSNATPIECTDNPSFGVPTNVVDNCGGRTSVTKVDVVSVNGCLSTITRTWTVTDQCGNSATCEQVIHMQDTKAPSISNCGNKYTVQGIRNTDGFCFGNATIISPTVTDMCDSNVTITNSFNNTANASGSYPLGQTIVSWTAIDDCGLTVMCQDTVVVLECTNCCWDSLAFAAIVAMDFNVIRDECSVHVSHLGLSTCQRVTYTWAPGVSSGYLTGTANASNNYGISGDYTICALIEELDSSGVVCFSSQKCFDVCVTCGDDCVDDRIVYECGKMVGESNANSELLVKNDLDYYDSLVYAVSGEMNNGFSDACVRVVDLNCNEVGKVLFTGNLDDYAGSVKYDKINDRLIVGGIFHSDTLYIPDMSNGFIKLVNSGLSDGFVASLNPVTLKAYWAFKIGDNWPDVVNDIVVNLKGDIYVGGSARNVMEFGPLNPSINTFTQRSVAVGFIAKYDYNGHLYWFNLVEPDKDCNISVRGLDVDEFDNVYAGGYFSGIYWDGRSPRTPAPHMAEIFNPPTGIVIDPYLNPDTTIFTDWTNFIIKYNDLGVYVQSREIFSGVNFGNEGHQIYDLEYDAGNVYVVGSNMIGSYDSTLIGLNWQYKTGLWDSNIKVQDGMIYTIGNLYNSYDQDHTLGGSVVNPSYSGIDFAVGIYALDGTHKKSMLIGGSNHERVAGLVTIPNSKDFFVQGLSRSIFDFHPNPNSPTPILSNIPSSGDRNIFIGKYSCACEPDNDCCEDLSASFSGQDSCCKTLDLVNNAGFDICHVTVELTSPGWILNTSSAATASGYIINPILNGIEISHTSGSLPTGSLNTLAEFCLSGSGTTLSTTQQFIVKWHENTTSGNKLVACTDTLTMSCYPPSTPDSCAVMELISVLCDSLNPNVYNVTFTVTNLTSNITATTAYLSGLPSGFNFSPCGSGTYSSSIAIPISPSIGPGMTSVPLCVQIYSTNPLINPTDVCFEMNLKGLDGSYFACCEESEDQCVTLTPCCLPCEDLEVKIHPIAIGGKDICCYSLSISNQCNYQYFTKMDVTILTPNVHFGYISANSSWSNCTPPTLQNICMAPNSGTIGSGNFNDVIQFCMANVTSSSQVPQQINVKFYTADSNGSDSLACDTIIYLACPFMPTLNDSCVIVSNSIVYCDPENNKYNVSMTITNNSNPNFCAQELVINLLEPGLANPSAIQLSDPLCYGESVTINFMLNTSSFPDIDGIMPLIISMKNLDGTCCRGGLAYIDTLMLPECPCATTCCASGQNEDFENYPLGNLPNNQVGWVSNQGLPQVVSGGANGSGKSISLHAGSRGVRPASISYGNSGVVGPDTIFEANKQYCITFWAKLIPAFNQNGILGIYADSQLIQTIIIPSNNTAWTQYSFNFIAPPPGQEILIFTNESLAPTDAGSGILLDQICFDEVVQIFNDMTPPVLSCPMNLTIQDTDLDCSVPYVIPNISITDPSGVGTVQCYLDGTFVAIGSSHNLSNAIVHTIQFVAEDLCGNRDSCSYNVIIECDSSCCIIKQNFVDAIEDAVTYNINNSLCKVTLNIDTLPDCDYIEGINWGDGTITAGPFTGGEMLMHTYNASGNYSITMLGIETNPTTGFICFEHFHTINVTLQCQTCICPTNIPPFTLTHNNVRTDVKCGDTIDIGCPVTSLFITGLLNCQSTSTTANCPPNQVSWALDRPTLPNLTGSTTTGNISVMLPISAVSEPGLYSLTFSTICSGSIDECTCTISWIQEDCNMIDTCCNNMQAFIDRSENAVHEVADYNNCKIILNIDSLPACDSIERIIWGDGTSTSGQLAGGQMFMHNYNTSGLKNVIIWFNAFNDKDSVCLRYKVEKSIFLNCPKDSLCTCGTSFNNTYFKLVNGPTISTICNGNAGLIPCPSSRPLTFYGSFNCSVTGCPPSNLTYKIVSVSTGLPVASGTLTALNFSIPFIGSWFDPNGGFYYIELSGQCGTATCKCKINFRVPPCPKSCLCDPNFSVDVSSGFYTFGKILSCNKRFTPKNLCPKDLVTWTLNGIIVDYTSGVGSTSFIVNPGFSTVCMIVDRLDSNNNKCRDTVCQRVYCRKRMSSPLSGQHGPINGDFELSKEGGLPNFGSADHWVLKKGKGYIFGEEGVDNANVLLTSKINSPAELMQECCLDITNNNILTLATLDIQNFDTEKVPLGTTLRIIAQEFENGGARYILGSKDLSDISSHWEEISLTLTTSPMQYPYLIVQIQNPNADEANIRIDNLSFKYVSKPADVSNINFTIYPNPTKGQLNIQFSSPVEQDVNMKVLDILGREVNSSIIYSGSSDFNFSIDDLSGIYIIQLTDSSGNSIQRRVIKIE
jgi:hypothetical protein